MKLGVIADGISRDFEHALKVMTETGLEHVELQFLWDKEIGDQTPEEIQKIKDLVTKYKVRVSCISRHNFSGLPIMATEPEDEIYMDHLASLKRCIDIAKEKQQGCSPLEYPGRYHSLYCNKVRDECVYSRYY